ncbi:MAG: hypothetical protein NTX24_01570 [Candidatus Pacearchaeota archaeon]|nr:hypothetical protein [Candidatus Pacearchaeota archaeon]
MWKLNKQDIEDHLLTLESNKKKIRYLNRMLYLERVENAARPFCFKVFGDIYLEGGNLRAAMDCYLDTEDSRIIKTAGDEFFKRDAYGPAMQAYKRINDGPALIKVGNAALKSEKKDDLFIAGICFEEANHPTGLNLVAERYLERVKKPKRGVMAAWSYVERMLKWEPEELEFARQYFRAAGNGDGLRRVKQIDDERGYKPISEDKAEATRKIENDLTIARKYEKKETKKC